ncbi:MAG: DUF4326 domain-containing protein [Planctomycetaceae bacterium]|nr:DUF4326 domain-containing protein [Planctomycetaceae bacterium]
MVEPKRIQRKRTKGWRMPRNAVYVGRPGKFGNPYQTADGFRRWLNGEPSFQGCLEDRRKAILNSIDELRGKDLACWCGLDKDCHADVLLELAKRSD